MTNELRQVFISYRRVPSLDLAQQIYSHLCGRGYDVFLDKHTLGSGRFDLQIKDEIQRRTRFVLLLAPDTLARCFGPDGQPNPDDFVRLEIEHALACERSIVPVLHEGFTFSQYPQYFTGTFKDLSKYQALDSATNDPFQSAMDKLCKRYLEATSAEEYENRAESARSRGAALENLTDGIIASLYDSQRARLRFKRADLYLKQGSYPAAITDYGWALQYGYSEPENIYANRGSAYCYSGDYASAVADFSRALELTPRSWYYTNRGEALFAAGEYTAALNDFQRALELAPRDSVSLAGVAISQYALGEKTSACQNWQTLLRQDDRYRDVTWILLNLKWVNALAEAAIDLNRMCLPQSTSFPSWRVFTL